jgi:hypothetical protein
MRNGEKRHGWTRVSGSAGTGVSGGSRRARRDALRDVDVTGLHLAAVRLALLLVVVDRGLDGVLGEHRAMELDGREAEL